MYPQSAGVLYVTIYNLAVQELVAVFRCVRTTAAAVNFIHRYFLCSVTSETLRVGKDKIL